MGGESFPGSFDENLRDFNTLFIDAYNQVFFSIGVCFGVMYSYSSYNPIKKPVI